VAVNGAIFTALLLAVWYRLAQATAASASAEGRRARLPVLREIGGFSGPQPSAVPRRK